MDDQTQPTEQQKPDQVTPVVKKSPKTSSRKKLTLRQRKWVREYLKTSGNATEAARIAYPEQSPKSQAATGWRNTIRPYMQDEINAICAKAGLSLDNVIADLNEILEKCKQSGNMSEALKGLRLSLEVLGTIGSKSTIQVNTQVNLKTDSLDLIRQRLEQRFKTDPVNRAEVIDVNSNTTEESITGTNQPKVS